MGATIFCVSCMWRMSNATHNGSYIMQSLISGKNHNPSIKSNWHIYKFNHAALQARYTKMSVSVNLQFIHISQCFKKHFQNTHCSLIITLGFTTLRRFATMELYMHFCFNGQEIFWIGQKYARQTFSFFTNMALQHSLRNNFSRRELLKLIWSECEHASGIQDYQSNMLTLWCKESFVIIKTHYTNGWVNLDKCGPHL